MNPNTFIKAMSTADSAASGRLKVDAGSKEKRAFAKKAVSDAMKKKGKIAGACKDCGKAMCKC
jgi:hypothetical protein